jgi:cell division protein FtsZ
VEAFQVVDEVLKHAIEGISSLITVHGLVNVDFADVKTIMQDAGTALMGIGYGTGDSRAAEAARAAIDSPLLETSIHGAQGILFNITGGNDLSMFEVDEAARIITEASAPEANIIFGAVIDEAFTGQVKCTVIATGFVEKDMPQVQNMATPAQQILKNNFSRPAPRSERQLQAESRVSSTLDTGFKTSSSDFNVEELEVPAFMRKPLSK